MNTTDTPSVQAQLDCLQRAASSLREIVAEIETQFGSEKALILAAGAMRSLSLIARMAQQIAREMAQ